MDSVPRGLRDHEIPSSADDLNYPAEPGAAGSMNLSLQNLDIREKTVMPSQAEESPSNSSSSMSLQADSYDSLDEPSENQGGDEKSDESEYEAGRLGFVGLHWAMHFESSGDLEDINRAISHLTQAVRLTPGGRESKPGMLNNLGLSHRSRFAHFGELIDLEQAIEYLSQAIPLAPDDHPEKPRMLTNLGGSYQYRFERLGNLKDIDQAIEYQSAALLLAPDGHEDRLMVLNNLGGSYQARFGRIGNLADIGRSIEYLAQALMLLPDEPSILNNLGGSYLGRFSHLGDLADVNKAIEYQSRAVLPATDGRKVDPGWLYSLGNSHMRRFEHLGEIADIERAVECRSQAVSLTPDGHPYRPMWLDGLGNSYMRRFTHVGKLADINQAIDCHTQAVSLTPGGHAERPGRLGNLGNSYNVRFDHVGELIDVDRAIECLSEAVLLTLNGHVDKRNALNNLAKSYQGRFRHLEELADIDRAIECQSQAVLLVPDGHAARPGLLSNLGSCYESRFEHLRELSDINRAIECRALAASLAPDGRADKITVLGSLGNSHQRRFEHLGEPADIDQAILFQSQAVSLSSDGHAGNPGRLNNLGNSYQRRFRSFKKLEDIDKAIECHLQTVLITPDGHVDKPLRLRNLGNSYNDRFEHLGEISDINHAISFLRTAAISSNGESGTRFKASRQWAQLASVHDSPSALSAYGAAMELVPKIAWIGSTTSRRYESIRAIGGIATEAAAAAISQNEHALALEWLEAGQSIVWNQTLQLRTQFDDLSVIAPDLAARLKRVAHNLEFASLRKPVTVAREDDVWGLEAAAQQHRRLAERYDQLIGQARELAGFESFMRPKKIVELMSAARSGPVIVVNLHTTRCDALIMRPRNEQIGHVPLPKISHREVAELEQNMKKSLLSKGIRERGFRRLKTGSGDQFESILGALWHKIVQPVLAFLGYQSKLPVDQLPHITWCTTGALSFLPLHAAGCYDHTGNNIYNFAVSSYSPNIGALIRSPSHSIELGGILAVGQEATPGCLPLPGTQAELAHIQPHAKSTTYMQLEDEQATIEAVLENMGKYNSVHLACHASQNIERPTESCFYLHNGSLTLAQIAKGSLKDKGMAFLSACQTATGDKELPDEAIHLAAGMLVAGYPTVIATLWSISDEDAPSIADLVYGKLVKDGKLDGARAARALHAAVGALHAQIGEKEFVRWVPYIHMGI